MKRVLVYLLVVVIIIGAIGAVIYFLTRTGNLSGNQGQTGSLPSTNGNGEAFNQGANGSLPNGDALNNGSSSATAPRLTTVSNEPALDYFVDNNGGATIIEPDGEVANVSNVNADIISNLEIQNIISAGFSYDGAKILVNFGDPNSPQTSVFDLETKAWTPLPVGMVSPRWSPTDYRIVYLRNNPNGTETLTTLDASKIKNNSVVIITLHIQDVSLFWSSQNKILFYDNPSIYAAGSVWAFDLQKKSLTPIVVEQRGTETAWSNTPTTMGIVFVGNTSQYGGRLQFVDGAGNPIEQFGFLTLPSKCVFNPFIITETTSSIVQAPTTAITSSTANPSYLALYCGIPRDQDMFSSSKLPDDYEQMALFTSDNIYRINTSNGNMDILFDDQNKNMDVSHIKIFNNSLFFINRYDQKLYSLSIAR